MRTMAILLMILVILWWPAAILAQDIMPEPQAGSNPGPPPPGLVVPIDNGIIFLVLSGVLLGFYTLKSYLQKSN